MKAFQVRCGLRPPRTHDLDVLADAIREAALILTQYAVDARYSGTDVEEDELRRRSGMRNASSNGKRWHVPCGRA